MKISGYQLFWLIFTMIFGMTAIFTVSPAVFLAKQDTWISIIVATLIGLFLTFVAVKLSLLYPEQTFIEYSQTILGKWLGKILLIPYFLMWISVTGIILREYADFVFISLFSSTPLWMIILIMLGAVVYVTCTGGLKSIGRCGEIIGPISAIGCLLIFIFSVKDWNWLRILPVYANTGFLPIVKGSFIPASFLAESFMVVMLIAFMSNPRRAMLSSLAGVAAASVAVLAMTVIVILVFGPNLPAKFIYPLYSVVTYISVMEFIQNVDVLAVLLWIIGIFIKLSLYFFITSYGTAQLFRIKRWKRAVWLIAPIVFVISLLPRNTNDTMDYARFWLAAVFPVNLIGIPLLLWMIGTIRQKNRAH
ncbi:GerAB/ArcD/ProY family transporter [Paenibacillus arenilitoris]|uniref:Endospore germination permease n=1 Tax=Paenibacillus arenilitoris TaxID=2772299 RepID=A0A927H4C6_9BACL|nr:endospore germination permease [Paenibacillus arenilitoris]MBD2867242.1 endospore germination permease [Paenibacillus arenilitoris]